MYMKPSKFSLNSVFGKSTRDESDRHIILHVDMWICKKKVKAFVLDFDGHVLIKARTNKMIDILFQIEMNM